jgi:hypothetical protein
MKQIKEDQLIAEKYLKLYEDVAEDDDILAGMKAVSEYEKNAVYKINVHIYLEYKDKKITETLVTNHPTMYIVDDKERLDDYVAYLSKAFNRIENIDKATKDNYITPAVTLLLYQKGPNDVGFGYTGFCRDVNKLYSDLENKLIRYGLPKELISQLVNEAKSSKMETMLTSEL